MVVLPYTWVVDSSMFKELVIKGLPGVLRPGQGQFKLGAVVG